MAILVQSNKKPSVSYPSQTGSIVTFNSQYAGLPLKSCVVNIPVTQEGTGDPSPDNVRNFVGVSSLDFTANSVVRTFQFGQTIYAGELDVLTGIFTATHKVSIFDGSESWEYWSDNSCFFLNGALDVDDTFRTGNVCLCNWLAESSSIFNSSGMRNKPDLIFCNQTNFPQRLWLKMTQFTTETDFKNFLSQNNLQIWYPLPTPEVINLGGMEIATLQGENNLFASTDETTASYIKIGG